MPERCRACERENAYHLSKLDDDGHEMRPRDAPTTARAMTATTVETRTMSDFAAFGLVMGVYLFGWCVIYAVAVWNDYPARGTDYWPPTVVLMVTWPLFLLLASFFLPWYGAGALIKATVLRVRGYVRRSGKLRNGRVVQADGPYRTPEVPRQCEHPCEICIGLSRGRYYEDGVP